MDREQIIYKLKCALEVNKLQDFEKECSDQITQIDTFIKVKRALLSVNSLSRKCARTTTWTFCNPSLM
jgi:hypothetical protein